LTAPATSELLNESSALAHLRARGLLPADAEAEVTPVSGGVSNIVLRVEAPGFAVIVKQALPRLRVEREWLADPHRTVAEGRALRLAAGVDPARVPPVLDLDQERLVLVIEAAPRGVRDWKAQLLLGEVDPEVGRKAGEFLGRLHRATRDTELDGWEPFEQLRLRPYFRTLVEDDPELRPLVLPHVDEIARRRGCLVHGDVSPKNVLTAPGLLWLIDFEVAHRGDPSFDVAFMLCHLTLKSIHVPAAAPALHDAASAFLGAYAAAGGPAPRDEHLVALLGLLLMARVRGRSPAEYLDAPERESVWRLGMRLAQHPALGALPLPS
jgi:5-methylthioribose kinase